MADPIAPRGLIADLITPLKGDGSIDGRGLKRLLNRVTPCVEGIFLASPHAGEGEGLNPAQRSQLVEKAAAVIRGRIPLLIWVTRDTEENTKDAILSYKKSLQKQGYEGQIFWVDTPLYYHSNRGLQAYYRTLVRILDYPLILHNDPEFIRRLGNPLKRNNIRTAILKELAVLKEIAGVIFSGTLDRAHNYNRASRGRAHFRIYDGLETQFLEHPSMSGLVSVGSNLAPGAWQKITRSSLQLTGGQKQYPDHLHQVWELGQYLRDLNEIYSQMPAAVIKETLADMGIIETSHCTFPHKDVKEQKGRLKELMTRYGDYGDETP